MKMHFFNTAILGGCIALVLCISSCSSSPCGSNKDEFVKTYTTFIDGLKSTDDNAVWEDKDRKLHSYIKECYPKYKMELGVMQHKDFWVGVVRYYHAKYGMEAIVKILEVKELFEYLKNSNLNINDLFKQVTGGLF